MPEGGDSLFSNVLVFFFFRFAIGEYSHLAVQRQRLLTINQVEGITLVSSLLPWLAHTLGFGKNVTLNGFITHFGTLHSWASKRPSSCSEHKLNIDGSFLHSYFTPDWLFCTFVMMLNLNIVEGVACCSLHAFSSGTYCLYAVAHEQIDRSAEAAFFSCFYLPCFIWQLVHQT